jgi:UDP-N-acetylglucosamine 2-epimerase (non-hydrolysing)
MPEEINRILTDHLSDLLFVTEKSGIQNLQNEGIPRERIHFVGNTMIDSLLAFKQKAQSSPILESLGLRSGNGTHPQHNAIGRYAVLTLHRPSNVDHHETFASILAGLEELASDCPIIFPVHPRTRRQIREAGLDIFSELGDEAIATGGNGHPRRGIVLTGPMGYLDFLCLTMHASIVVTDSGGIQEETTCLGIPCVTVRENTERPVTVEIGTNIVAGTRTDAIRDAIRVQTSGKIMALIPEKWDGQAAVRIVEILARVHREATSPALVPQVHSGMEQEGKTVLALKRGAGA